MLSLFLKFLLAHLVGDFLLQPNSWISDKIEKKERSVKLLYHILVHLALMLVFTGFIITLLPAIGYIALTHYVIDIWKLRFSTPKTQALYFTADQLLHLLVLAGVSLTVYPQKIEWRYLVSNQVILFLIALVMITYVTAMIIRVAISRWRVDDASLSDAGKYIGMGERLLIFFFIITNHWEGVGFLLAAKSIFRFGDLNKDNDRKLTEYVLIGTLLSFGLALLISMLYLWLLPFAAEGAGK